MKVVIINEHPQDFLGGSEIQCDIIARKLQEFGHQVVYLACKGNGIYDTPYPVKAVKLSADTLAQAAINEKPDIVYWRNNKNSFRSTVKIIRKKGIPVVFAVSHINDTIKWIMLRKKSSGITYAKHFISYTLRLIKERWNHSGFKCIDGVIVNNEHYLKKLNIEPQIYIPNSNISGKKNFEWKKPFICWVANLKAQKRPELCIDIAKRLGKNYDVLMVGKIQTSKYEWIKNNNYLPENLIYLGPKTVLEVNGIISSSICLIHTCTPEGFPGNFIQAWLHGKPVVSYEFDPGGLINSEKLGLVSNQNMDQFSADIKKLVESPALTKEIGERARKYAHKHFHPETNVRKLEKFLLNIISNSVC